MRSAESRAAWIEGTALAAVVALLLVLGGETVRASYHGFLHARVGAAVLEQGLLPENPYHAGSLLRYYTLYPALGVALGRLGFGVLGGFALLNVVAALLFGPALDALGRSFGLSWSARRWAFVAAVFGFNALGWIGWLAAGGSSAPPDSAPVMQLAPLTFAGSPFGWDQRLQAFLPKFLNVSSFAFALPFGLWALAGGLEARPEKLVRTAVAAGVALAINPLVGGFCGLVLACWLLPEVVAARGLRRLAWPLGGSLALLLALPFLLPALRSAPTGGPRIEVAIGGHPWADWLGPLALLLPLALPAWWRSPRRHRWRLGLALGLAALLLLAAELPWGNQYKMARLGALLWALPAGVSLAALGERRRLLPWLFLLLALPTTALVPSAYLRWADHAPPLPLEEAAGGFALRAGAAPPIPQELLDAERDAGAAVLLIDPFGLVDQLGGGRVQGHPLAPLFRHPLLVDRLQVHNEGQPDLEMRLAFAHALFQPDSAYDPAAVLPELWPRIGGRDLVVLGLSSGPEAPRLTGLGAAVVRAAGGFSLWRLSPPSPPAGS